MPQRFHQGLVATSQQANRKSNSRTALKKAAARTVAQAEVGCRPMVEHLEQRELLSATYYVSPNGSNTNSGTLAAPFKTIQFAADVAGYGGKVEIEGGTYYETVTPKSGQTFQNYNGEKVTISGANPISGFTDYSGSIYSAYDPTTLGAGNDQVFVNGVAINWAEWPNTAIGDWSRPTTATMQATHVSGDTAVIYNSALSQPTNYWAGSYIHMDPGQAWVDEIGTVVSSAPGSITVHFVNDGHYAEPTAGNQFQIFGTFKALNTAGQWRQSKQRKRRGQDARLRVQPEPSQRRDDRGSQSLCLHDLRPLQRKPYRRQRNYRRIRVQPIGVCQRVVHGSDRWHLPDWIGRSHRKQHRRVQHG
jgi:hypothetical protein